MSGLSGLSGLSGMSGLSGYPASAPFGAPPPMGAPDRWMTMLAGLGAAISAGVFLAFSFFVMPAVVELPTPEAIEAMQALDRIAPGPYMLVAFGTAMLCIVVGVRGLMLSGTTPGRWMLAGVVAFWVAGVVVTVVANVPLSYTIDQLDPSSPDAAAAWADLSAQWTWFNHLRTLGSVVAAAALALALRPPKPLARS